MAPISSPLQSSAPTFSLATLRAVLAESQAAEPERGMRWDHAAMIVALRRVQPGYTGDWWVESECEPNKWYFVVRVLSDRWTCTCKDFSQRGGPCKHALAVRLLLACEARESRPAPIPFPARTLPDDAPIPFELTERALAALEQEPTPGA
jgi:hypothetical protein